MSLDYGPAWRRVSRRSGKGWKMVGEILGTGEPDSSADGWAVGQRDGEKANVGESSGTENAMVTPHRTITSWLAKSNGLSGRRRVRRFGEPLQTNGGGVLEQSLERLNPIAMGGPRFEPDASQGCLSLAFPPSSDLVSATAS